MLQQQQLQLAGRALCGWTTHEFTQTLSFAIVATTTNPRGSDGTCLLWRHTYVDAHWRDTPSRLSRDKYWCSSLWFQWHVIFQHLDLGCLLLEKDFISFIDTDRAAVARHVAALYQCVTERQTRARTDVYLQQWERLTYQLRAWVFRLARQQPAT